jgi:uncharacterized coiled-coil protein SlyX
MITIQRAKEMTQTNYNTANIETFNFRGFFITYSSTIGDYRVYAGETFIGETMSMQGVNKIIDSEVKRRKAQAAEMTISASEVMANIVTINALNAKVEAQDAELARLRAENAAMAKQLKRARNYAAAVSQPNAYGVSR